MPLSKCPRCEKIFDKSNFPVCNGCREAEEADYTLVRDTIAANSDLTAEEVSEECGVDLVVVKRMLDTGKVKLVFPGDLSVTCGRCGAPAISASKKLCQGCLDALNRDVAMAQKDIRLAGKKKVETGAFSDNVRKSLDDKRH